jgi:pimeloyl-ACP methyl ester carboxylesterase
MNKSIFSTSASLLNQARLEPMNAKTLKKSLRRVLLFAVGCYIALIGYLYSNQRELIFVGSQFKSHLEMSAVHGAGAALEKIPTSEGTICSVLFAPALTRQGVTLSDAPSKPYILFFYGNGGSLSSSMGIIYQLQIRGLNVCAADFPGYGDSTGLASERGNFEAATLAYDYLTKTRHISPSRIAIFGWSLGAASAIDLAARVPHSALITCSAFSSMVTMSNHLYPIVPVPLLKCILKYPFDNIDKMRTITGPVLIVHSRGDKFIPYENSNLLAAACKGDVSRYTVATGDHGELFNVGGAPLYDAITNFCYNHTPGQKYSSGAMATDLGGHARTPQRDD